MELIKKHPRIFIIFLILVLFICFFIAINLGSIQVSIVQLFKGLFIEYDVDVASVYSIRFPRIIISMLVGGALALSGLLFQVVLKNPLADPGIIGIANGASLVSVLVGLFLPQLSAIAPLLSFFGGLITFAIIYSLSWKAGFKTTRIILIGVAINYTISALVTLANSATASITSGATGTISLYTWQDVTTLLIYLVPVIIITLFMAKACNLLGLEDRILTSLGVNVNVYRFGLSLLAVLLCSISVAVVGVIGFIGLLVPHISRLLVGTEHKHLIPISILIGAIVLLVADTVGRIIMAPYEILMLMEVKKIKFSYQDKPFIEELSVKFKKNKITSIIGPNGSGKSTLLMLLSRIYKAKDGTITLNDKNVWDYKIKEFAKNVAVVHQKNQIYGDLDVKTIVGYGRLPYLSYHQNLSEEDYQIIDWAIATTNLKEYENRLLANLSGGQQQRVWLAMALAQKTPILLLDEPTTYLDVKYQIEILNLIKEINKKYQMTVIMVHHDINQAINYSDEIIAMKDGKILFQGVPEEVITSASLKSLYDYDLSVIDYNHQKIVLNYQ